MGQGIITLAETETQDGPVQQSASGPLQLLSGPLSSAGISATGVREAPFRDCPFGAMKHKTSLSPEVYPCHLKYCRPLTC
jgi:hypothetical protein